MPTPEEKKDKERWVWTPDAVRVILPPKLSKPPPKPVPKPPR